MMMTRMMKRRGKSGVGQLEEENEEIRDNLQKEKETIEHGDLFNRKFSKL